MTPRAQTAGSTTNPTVEDTIRFTVDAALLRELGERLVGRPHIALAELIKNSYDADATVVRIVVGDDEIEVADNGHGMTFEEFKDFWMRIGSPHKESQFCSREHARPLTGSKGVGRLAVQFLASELVLTTRAKRGRESLTASVDWRRAVEAADLTSAEAHYRREPGAITPESFPGPSRHGTRIRMATLRHQWTKDDFVDLAREIWALQPPFARASDDPFAVELQATDENLVQQFDSQMRAWLHLWHARLRGRAIGHSSAGAVTVELSLEFEGEPPELLRYEVEDAPVHAVEFEIRVYSLHHRQRFGVRVQEAREYLRRQGGVHLYDAGFHLPYYGPDTDWLHIEADHAIRGKASELLPGVLTVPEGMQYLPTNRRLFGVVNVNTGQERQHASADPADQLQIQVSRDRLVGNRAFEGLRRTVRWALDYYAMQEARRSFEQAARRREAEPLPSSLDDLRHVLATHRDDISPQAFAAIDRGVASVVKAGQAEQTVLERQAALLGALATAGMSALAIEHEVNLQLEELERLSAHLRREASKSGAPSALGDIADRMTVLLDRIRATRRLFGALLDEEDRDRVERLAAGPVVDGIVEQVRPFLRGVPVTLEVDATLLLPAARLAEWTALFQNVLVNAVNAMLDSPVQCIVVRSRTRGRKRSIVVEDTGRGVDLNEAEVLFEPFERRSQISTERRMLGLGGTGLGLTIVRLIARNARCSARFIEPSTDFSTAFELAWTE